MTLQSTIVADLLDTEVAIAQERLGDRISAIFRVGTQVHCVIEKTNVGTATLRLEGAGYDAEPLQVAVITPDGQVAPREGWPGTLFHSIHPVLDRPFACVQGTYEYHCLPCHMADRWDAHRGHLRLAELLSHLVKKARQ
jgi:hypothetical protein